jgi:hypothetical protein
MTATFLYSICINLKSVSVFIGVMNLYVRVEEESINVTVVNLYSANAH